MIRVLTYRVNCRLPAGGCDNGVVFSAGWLRGAVSRQLKKLQKEFSAVGADSTLFHNHKPGIKDPEIGYPQIIFHCINNSFFITGINAGAGALTIFAELTGEGGFTDNGCYMKFGKFSDENSEIAVISGSRAYELKQWLPMTPKEHVAYKNMNLRGKAAFLEQKLDKHITADLAKYLALKLEAPVISLDDITAVYPEPVQYKRHNYPAFDVVFKANVVLPRFITLGNIKSLGYGRIEIL
jgi:hypothetical protein